MHIDRTRDHIASGPRYDPDLINKPHHLTSVCDHYGIPRDWQREWTAITICYIR